MDHKDWEILKMLSEEKNVTKAAERLYISQPALTYRLKNMEKEFGTKLVVRNPNGILLTHQGEYLLAYALEMIQKLQDTKERIKNMENKVLTNESDKEQETPVIEKIDNSKDKDSINDIWMELHLMNIKLGGILKVLDNIIKKI